MERLKPCPNRRDDFFDYFCHIEIIKTAEPEPKNIRMICKTHDYVLPGSYVSIEDAEEAWNWRTENG